MAFLIIAKLRLHFKTLIILKRECFYSANVEISNFRLTFVNSVEFEEQAGMNCRILKDQK